MSLPSDAALIITWLVAWVFLWAGVTKLLRPDGAARAVVDFGITKSPSRAAGRSVGVLEVGIALFLVVPGTARLGASMATLVLVVFTGLIGRALHSGRDFPCFCFGTEASRISRGSLARSASLAALTGTVTIAFPALRPDPLETVLAAAASLSIVGAAVVGWLLISVLSADTRRPLGSGVRHDAA